jgi:hypothetical protein
MGVAMIFLPTIDRPIFQEYIAPERNLYLPLHITTFLATALRFGTRSLVVNSQLKSQLEPSIMKTLRLLWFALIFASSLSFCHAQQLGDFKITYSLSAKDRPRHEDEGSPSQKGSASFRFYFSPRISVKIANDNFVSKKPAEGSRITGFGDTAISFDADVVLEDSTGVKQHPSFSFTYAAYLPTGNVQKGISTGRVDHEILGAITKSVGESAIVDGEVVKRTNLEVDVGGYFAGNPGESGYTAIGELNLAMSRTLDALNVGKFTYHGEIDMTSRAKGVLSEIYALNELRTRLPHKLLLITGVRVGITPNSPRIGAYASLTFSGSFRRNK